MWVFVFLGVGTKCLPSISIYTSISISIHLSTKHRKGEQTPTQDRETPTEEHYYSRERCDVEGRPLVGGGAVVGHLPRQLPAPSVAGLADAPCGLGRLVWR